MISHDPVRAQEPRRISTDGKNLHCNALGKVLVVMVTSDSGKGGGGGRSLPKRVFGPRDTSPPPPHPRPVISLRGDGLWRLQNPLWRAPSIVFPPPHKIARYLGGLSGPISRDIAILSLRYPISCDTVLQKLALLPNGAIPPLGT